ncbi:MAG: YwaF family protein [Clostridia bacterium]|nr:YwaF family protein [Clostridia bacterium]
MEFLRTLIEVLDTRMITPEPYGWFHLLWLAASVIAGILLFKFLKPGTEKQVRGVLLVISLLSILAEIYKQFNYTFSVDGDVINADYQWYAFPWQFCCVPMFIGLAAALVKKGKVHDALCAFLATYSLFAGICVMLYPVQVFISVVGINIETMYCHGSMITLAMYLLCTGYVKAEHKTILKAIPVFCSVLGIALVLNEVNHYTDFTGGETFNMFYVSPYEDPSLPVYSIVQEYVPYPFSLIIYIVMFTVAAYLMLLMAMGIKKIAAKIKAK